jgi:predicted nucleic acid-binding protein
MVGVAAVLALALSLPADWVVSRDRVPRALALGGRAVLAVAGALGASALMSDVLEIL